MRFAQCTNIAEHRLVQHAMGSLMMCCFMSKENLLNGTAEGCQMRQHKASRTPHRGVGPDSKGVVVPPTELPPPFPATAGF